MAPGNKNRSETEKEPFVEGGFDRIPGDFSIRIQGSFEASHFLTRYYPDGSDEALHGHSWKVEVFLSSSDGTIQNHGIVYDFLAARQRLDALLGRLDHTLINDLSEFSGINPTSENIARWFYSGLRGDVQRTGGRILEIRIFEGPENVAIFRPG